MGRPVNKDKIGLGAGRIAVTRHYFTGGSEATTDAHIVRQVSDNRFVVRLNSSTAPHTGDEILKLVPKAGSGATDPLSEGEFAIDAAESDSTVVQISKIRNRTVQYIDASGDEHNAVYAIGHAPEGLENNTNPANEVSVSLPAQ